MTIRIVGDGDGGGAEEHLGDDVHADHDFFLSE